MRGLTDEAFEALDGRLRRDSPRPLAVAFSGGGDSLALLLIADAWAKAAGRELLVLTVDHRLQPQSQGWTASCAAVARRLDRPFRALAWEGDKPANGLPAAARAARHRLIAEAAREAGATVVLVGHTADDVAEARAMRASGSTTPEPRAWSPSPAWPEGRGLFLLRPLIDTPRSAIRTWLAERGEAWIEDPANLDTRFARVRARLAGTVPAPRADPPPLRLGEACADAAGVITMPRAAVRMATEEDVRRLLAIACVCAGGGARRPAGVRVARAAAALRDELPLVATLAGARLEADHAEVRVFREAGEAARGGLAPAALAPGVALVWDGRFEITVARQGLEARRLAGLFAGLPRNQQQRLRAFPPAARGGLPALVDAAGHVSSPALDGAPDAKVRSLVGERLRAACGLVAREPA